MIQLDPSVEQTPADEIKRLTQLTRGRSRGGGGVRSTSTRPTYQRAPSVPFNSKPQPLTGPNTFSNPEDVYSSESDTSISNKINSGRPITDEEKSQYDTTGGWDFHVKHGAPPSISDTRFLSNPDVQGHGGVDDPSSDYYTGPGTLAYKQTHPASPEGASQGQDMSGAYKSLLDSVAKQHLGQPQQGAIPGDLSQHMTSQGASHNAIPGDLSQQGGGHDPRQAFHALMDSVAMQHGGRSPSEGGRSPSVRPGPSGPTAGGPGAEFKDPMKGDPAWGDRFTRKEHTRGEQTGALPPPPKFPHGGNKEQVAQYKNDHAQWEDQRQYALANANIENRESSKSRSNARLELAAVKAQHEVAQTNLDEANSAFEKGRGLLGGESSDPKLKEAVVHAKSVLDKISARKDKILKGILGEDEEDQSDDPASPEGASQGALPTIGADDDAAFDKLAPGTKFMDSEGKQWVKN